MYNYTITADIKNQKIELYNAPPGTPFKTVQDIQFLYKKCVDWNHDINITRSININALESIYQGPDASLDISLFEYGIAWDSSAYKEDPAQEIDFIIGSYPEFSEDTYGDITYTRFYHSNFDLYDFKDLFNKSSWCNVKEVADCSGLTIKELYQGFPYTLHDFILYYGVENFMAAPYWSGSYFTINEEI